MVRSIRLQWWLLWSVLTLAQMTSVHSKKIKRLRKGRNDGNSMNALTDSQIEEHLSQTVIQTDNSVVLTEVVVAFGYNVRYDTDSIAEDQMPHCLETSTTNLLLYNFGCDSEISMHSRRQRRHLSLRGTTSNVAQRSRGFETSEEQRLFAELLLRDQENRRLFDTVMSMDPSCNYIISTEVSTIIPQGKRNRENTVCRGGILAVR